MRVTLGNLIRVGIGVLIVSVSPAYARGPIPPPHVAVTSPSQTSLTLTWQAGTQPSASNSGYWVNYQPNPSMSKTTTDKLLCLGGKNAKNVKTGTQAVFNNLQPGTFYDFAVCAYSSFSLSATVRVSAKTWEATPPPPTGFVATPSETQIAARWVASAGTTAGYLLAIQQGKVSNLSCQGGTDLANLTSTKISGLSASTDYTLALCSYNHDKILSSSVVITATTPSNNGSGKHFNCATADGATTVAIYNDPVNIVSAPTVCPSGSQCYTQNYQLFAAISQDENNVGTYPVVSAAVINPTGGASLAALFNGPSQGTLAQFSVSGSSSSTPRDYFLAQTLSSTKSSAEGAAQYSSTAVPVLVVDSATNGNQFKLDASSGNSIATLTATLSSGNVLSGVFLKCK